MNVGKCNDLGPSYFLASGTILLAIIEYFIIKQVTQMIGQHNAGKVYLTIAHVLNVCNS